MENKITITIPVNELAYQIAELLKPLLEEKKIKAAGREISKEYLTRKETADILNVSLPTLNEYTKRSILIGYRFGARVLYKQSDIEAALTKMKHRRDIYPRTETTK